MEQQNTSKNTPVQKGRGKIWLMAIDPYAAFDFKPILDFTRKTAAQSGAEIHAAYVLAPASLNFTGDFNGPWMERYLPLARAKLREVLGDEWKQEVIPCAQAGLKESVSALVNHARAIGAECILISTHARRGLERMALGSFAESLTLTSPIPVIITNPLRKVPDRVRKILVPTDLDRSGHEFVTWMGDRARDLGAEVLLYYKQPDPLDPIVQQGVYSLGGGWVSVQNFIDDEIARKRKVMEDLERMLSGKGLAVSHILDSSPQDLVESIDRVAREHGCDLVALHTEAGPWASVLLGSVARGLIREASVPLLVQR